MVNFYLPSHTWDCILNLYPNGHFPAPKSFSSSLSVIQNHTILQKVKTIPNNDQYPIYIMSNINCILSQWREKMNYLQVIEKAIYNKFLYKQL